MTNFFDSEFDRIFKRMSNSFFNRDDTFEEFKGNGSESGPYCYGYTMTVGPDGKPVVKEYGNVKPGLLPTSDIREPLVDTIVDEKEKEDVVDEKKDDEDYFLLKEIKLRLF